MGLTNFILTCEKDNEELKRDINYYKNKASRLEKENQELKKQIEVGEEQYNDLVQEKEKLQEQLSSKTLQLEELKEKLEKYKATNKVLSHELTKDKVLQQDYLTICCGIPIGDIPKLLTQQKEFIKWLENGIEKVNNTEFLDERIQRAGLIAYNRCLQKYKKIIGDD